MRLGIFGGSFDPVHLGHLILAEQCRDFAQLDEIWFVPAATPPHKQQRRMATAKQRADMLQLAVHGNGAFCVCTLELDRGGVSYTVDTLAEIHESHSHAELFFLMGADSLHELPTWREPRQILELATPLVVLRGGEPEPDFSVLRGLVSPSRLQQIRELEVRMPAIDIRSTRLREDVAAGRSVRYRVPRSVEQYISTHNLYGA